MTKYIAQDYSHLQNIGQISNEAMQMHFKLYEGYVNNVNLINEKLEILEKNSPEWNELHRRFGWEWNGMRNHELFFESLKPEDNPQALKFSDNLKKVLQENFGSFENWKADFIAQCKIRGMGWVMLVKDNKTGKLFNTFVNEHEQGMLADVKIILLIDMFEHAYIKDFGINRVPYIESIFEHINWEVVEKRLLK
jgi:Fe-Mn family superoxide dismutase